MRKEKKESGKTRKESRGEKGRRNRRGSEDEIVRIEEVVRRGNRDGEGADGDEMDVEEEEIVPAVEEEENDGDGDKTLDWCLVCKDGGKLRVCDYPRCNKVYHFNCVNKPISFLRSGMEWHCPRHTCFRCPGIAIASCYCCPSAACSNCLRTVQFVRIGDENGFCKKCIKFVLYFEKVTKRKPNDDSTSYEDFTEYYEAVKKKSGFTLDDIQAAYNGLKSGVKRKNSSLFEADVSEKLGPLQKMRLDSSKTSVDEENPPSNIVMVPTVGPENVKLIYLTRSVIEKLLKQPESFENKVKGSFIGIDLPQKGRPNKVDRQLLQVTGIARTLSPDGKMAIKLQAKNTPNDMTIDMVSDLDFREILCKDLRQKVKDGLVEIPTIEKLEQMTRVLSEDIVDDLIAREMKWLQHEIDVANEKGWRQKFYRLEDQRKLLETPSERLRLIRKYQTVISELRNQSTVLEDITNETQGIDGSPDTVALCKNDRIPAEIAVSRDCNKAPVVAHPVQEEGRVQVRKPVSKALLSLTMARVNSNQQVLEIKDKEIIPDQFGLDKRNTIRQAVRTAAVKAQTEQQFMHLIPSSLDDRHASSKIQQLDVRGCIGVGNGNLVHAVGALLDQSHEKGEELISGADDSNLPSLTWECECDMLPPSWEGSEEQKRFDVMNEECVINATELSAKMLVVKNQLGKMDEELPSRLEAMPKESSRFLTDAEFIRIEEKIDKINQQIEQMKQDKAQSAEGASLVPYSKKSDISMDDLFKLLEAVTSLACTKTLEEVKVKHFQDLDMKQFPIYDPNVTERVSPMFREAIESFINEGLAVSQVKIDSGESLVLQPLAAEHPEANEKVNPPAQ